MQTQKPIIKSVAPLSQEAEAKAIAKYAKLEYHNGVNPMPTLRNMFKLKGMRARYFSELIYEDKESPENGVVIRVEKHKSGKIATVYVESHLNGRVVMARS